VACGSDSEDVASNTGGGGSGGTGGGSTGGSAGASTGGAGTGGIAIDATTDGNTSCEPPDMLIALDRTLTMHRTVTGAVPTDAPDYQSSKWWQAVTALEQVTAAPLDQGVRFGLELWPKDPGGTACNTLAEQVAAKPTTNASCEAGEVVIPPGLGTGAAIASYLDPATTKLCFSTPTGEALNTAATYLAGSAVAGRDQFVVLVTDGADWDFSCPDPSPQAKVAELAAAGVKTFVVGFFDSSGSDAGGGVGEEFLNDMACAGQTAKGFPAPCTQEGNTWVATDPSGPTLYFQTSSATELTTALKEVAGSVCCNCVPR
jgi:hypothetical protein